MLLKFNLWTAVYVLIWLMTESLFLTSFSNQALRQEIQQGPSRGRASSKKSAPPPRSSKSRGAALPPRPRGPKSGPPPPPPSESPTHFSKFNTNGPYYGGTPGGMAPFRGPAPHPYRPPEFTPMQYPYYNGYNMGYHNGPMTHGYGSLRPNGYGPPPRPNGYGIPNGYNMPPANGYSPSSWSSGRLEVVPPPIPLQTYLEVGFIVV